MIDSTYTLKYIVAALLRYARTFEYACALALLAPRISVYKRIYRNAVAALLFITLAVPAFATEEDIGQPENVESVTLLVSSSMTAAISKIAREYSRTHNVDLNAVYESPSELVDKIALGDPADIIIVSDQKWLDGLQEQGVLDPNSRIKISENRLSLVTSKEFPLPEKTNRLEDTMDYIHSRALMVMADPEVGALGKHSKEVLNNIGRWNKFKKFLVIAPTSAKTVDLIIKSQTAGIVYSTDARLFADKLHYIGDIPKKLHSPIEYYAAIVLGNNMDEARKFLTYLSSGQAQSELKNSGFIVQ